MRRLAPFLLVPLLAGACPTVKESANIDIAAIGDTSITTTFTTANGNDLILAVPINWKSSSYATVTGVAGGGLVWTRRGGPHQMNSSTCFGVGSPCFVDVEVWQAYATAPLSSQSITATWNAGVLAGAMALQAFNSSPLGFDWNATLPVQNSNPSGAASLPAVSGVSTSAATGYLLSFCEWNIVPGSYCSPPSGYTGLAFAGNYQPFNARYMAVQLSGLAVAAPQSSITVTNTGNTTKSWIAFVDSLTCNVNTTTAHPQVWISE